MKLSVLVPVLALFLLSTYSMLGAEQPPNVVLIFADDKSYDSSEMVTEAMKTTEILEMNRICKSIANAADSVEFKAINYTLLQRGWPNCGVTRGRGG
ncbi:MAG: hypothetical protein H6821_13395 [Planctomycetaceae bacterium]|nr:hypothetical protein [Planctomycetaceae bacterium]HRX79603.1 hypothetical protein [Pirellulaceae bacterium]